MCVIVVKKDGVKMPSNSILKECFKSNGDGAGYMFAENGKVHIVKGFMSFDSFKKSLSSTRKKYGDEIPYVFHFRISTQGGVNKELCHPYPLTSDMEEMKKLKNETNIGVAHNGIISLTSSWGKTSYNDTMLFISDYLSELVKDRNDCVRFKKLIERLISGSRLSILFGDGNVELIGDGWIEEDGILYSNSSYKKSKYCDFMKGLDCKYDEKFDDYIYDDHFEEWELYWNEELQSYDFDESYCPLSVDDNFDYCEVCAKKDKCPFYKALQY